MSTIAVRLSLAAAIVAALSCASIGPGVAQVPAAGLAAVGDGQLVRVAAPSGRPAPRPTKPFNAAARPNPKPAEPPKPAEASKPAAAPRPAETARQRPSEAFNEAARPGQKTTDTATRSDGDGGKKSGEGSQGGGKKGGGDPPPSAAPKPPARPVFKPPSI